MAAQFINGSRMLPAGRSGANSGIGILRRHILRERPPDFPVHHADWGLCHNKLVFHHPSHCFKSNHLARLFAVLRLECPESDTDSEVCERAGDRSVDEVSLLRGVHVLIFVISVVKLGLLNLRLRGDFAEFLRC